MKIESINAQNTQTANTSGTPTSARERAIAKLMQTPPANPNAQATPVLDPSKVTPEEMTAIKPATSEAASTEANPAAAEGQTNTTEPPKAVTQEVPSPQLAQLARKEKALLAQQREIKVQQAALLAREEAIKASQAPTIDQSKYISIEDLTKNPWDLLAKHGVSYDQLTQQALNQPSPEQRALNQTIDELKSEIKSLKDGQDTVKKTYEEGQKQAYTQAVNQIRNEAKQLVANNPNFEAIAHKNAVNDVVQLIERTFHEDGVLMTVEEAANEIENHLIEEAISLTKLNKIQQRLKPTTSTTPAKLEADAKQSQPKPTLTNAVGSTRPLTAKERAILAFKGELKK